MKNEADKLWRRLRQEGFRVTKTGGQHICIRHPAMTGKVFAPSTPSDKRSLTNVRAKLRRAMRKAAG